jgi:hypothetical protein
LKVIQPNPVWFCIGKVDIFHGKGIKLLLGYICAYNVIFKLKLLQIAKVFLVWYSLYIKQEFR